MILWIGCIGMSSLNCEVEMGNDAVRSGESITKKFRSLDFDLRVAKAHLRPNYTYSFSIVDDESFAFSFTFKPCHLVNRATCS